MKYNELPEILKTRDDLYQLVLIVSYHFNNTQYSSKLSSLGMEYTDLANTYFLNYLERRLKPNRRIPFIKGRLTKPAQRLKLPIEKKLAYQIINRDMFDLLRKRTKEEKGHITLASLTDRDFLLVSEDM